MVYIKASSAITHQPTFKNPGFSSDMRALEKNSQLIRTDYKNYIDAPVLRRMSEILRMSITCSLECMQQSGDTQAGAIIAGTGLGCLFDTEKFLNNAIIIEGGMIPPTSFIQSTHNTIAGQISLIMQNHAYNMTHTQNTLSFEHALQDAILCLKEGKDNILTGAAEEYIEQLTPIATQLGLPHLNLTSGAAFFLLSQHKKKSSNVCIADVFTYGMVDDVNEQITHFIAENNLSSKQTDFILYASPDEKFAIALQDKFKSAHIINYQKYCGVFASNSSFALLLAADLIEHKILLFDGLALNYPAKRIIICNNLNTVNLGLILVEDSEA